ncbi:MAG: DmsE family decaheme c-type cytochrome [Oligoflexia bacterium]|nr:DmsE family decaheme c-type cytochrome [Oligoflexia bacterium]
MHAFLSLLGLLALGASSEGGTAHAAVEAQRCATCHEDEVESFQKSHHRKAWSMKDAVAANSCASCHGDPMEHLKSEGDVPMPLKLTGKGVDVAKASESCLKCHSTESSLSFWGAGKHGKNDVSCMSCHTLHGKAAVKPKAEACFTCHKDVKHDAQKLSHHPILEGKVSCSDCHNPHGTLNHGMLKAESVNQLCTKCHTDKRGPFLWEHAPVEENCMSCHDSHGSRNQKLLVEKTPNLCQTCHEVSHAKSPVGAAGGFHNVAGTPVNQFKDKLVARSCLNCHSKIHGSFAPHSGLATGNSGKYFLR